MGKAQADLEKEMALRKELEDANVKLLQEKNDMMITLESTKGSAADFLEKQAKLQQQKADLEAQVNELSSRLSSEEDARNSLFQGKKKTDQEIGSLKKDCEDMELSLQKLNPK